MTTHKPVIKNLWNLSACLVCAVTAQTTCTKGKRYTIWTLNCGHSSISIGSPASIIPQTNCVFHIFLKKERQKQYAV